MMSRDRRSATQSELEFSDQSELELSDVRSAVPQTLSRAAARVVSTATTSDLDDLARDAADDLDLCATFRDEVKVKVMRRLRGDPEYSPDKYPNTEEYFNGE